MGLIITHVHVSVEVCIEYLHADCCCCERKLCFNKDPF